MFEAGMRRSTMVAGRIVLQQQPRSVEWRGGAGRRRIRGGRDGKCVEWNRKRRKAKSFGSLRAPGTVDVIATVLAWSDNVVAAALLPYKSSFFPWSFSAWTLLSWSAPCGSHVAFDATDRDYDGLG